MKTTREFVPQFLRWSGSLFLVVGLLLSTWAVGPAVQAAPARATVAVTLYAKAGTLALPDGTTVPIWGYATSAVDPAQSPGPTIIADQGDTIEVTLHNDLAVTTALEFQGQNLVPDTAGVAPGGFKTYTFVAANPGTFLYEAGLSASGDGARQVAMGLFGALIVRPTGQPNWAYGLATTAFDEEALLIFSEVDPAFNNNPLGFQMQAYQPRYWLINGKAYPDTVPIDTAPGDKVLLRLVNAGLLHHSIGLLGLHQTVIATDGALLLIPYQSVAELLAAGQWVDTLVTVPPSAVSGARFALYEAGLLQHNGGQRLAPGGPLAFGGILTFLQIPGTLPDPVGPLVYNLQATPNPTRGTTGALLNATISDATTGNENIVAAEYFIDVLGAPGTGTAMTGAFGTPTVAVSALVPASVLAGLSDGAHGFYVRGKDAGDNWGAVESAVLQIDRIGPATVGLSLMPNPSNGSLAVTLRGTADESATGNAIVVAAEYAVDSGMAQPMSLSQTGVPVTELVATISAATVISLTEGVHAISVRSQDVVGNWGPWAIVELKVDRTGPTADGITAVPNYLDLTGAPPVTHVRLDAHITDNLKAGVQSPVFTAEGFINTVGADGSGFAMLPLDGKFDQVTEGAYYNISISHFAQLRQGVHTVYVHGKDAAGNWGPTGPVTVTVWRGITDTEGPIITVGPNLTPNPTDGMSIITLNATAADPGNTSNIAQAEWFQGADPGTGLAAPMQAVDGTFNAPTEELTALINVSGWGIGTYTISVRAMDEVSNWGAVTTATLTIDKVRFYLPIVVK